MDMAELIGDILIFFVANTAKQKMAVVMTNL
jgi:hypothetical protein